MNNIESNPFIFKEPDNEFKLNNYSFEEAFEQEAFLKDPYKKICQFCDEDLNFITLELLPEQVQKELSSFLSSFYFRDEDFFIKEMKNSNLIEFLSNIFFTNVKTFSLYNKNEVSYNDSLNTYDIINFQAIAFSWDYEHFYLYTTTDLKDKKINNEHKVKLIDISNENYFYFNEFSERPEIEIDYYPFLK